MHYNKGVWRVKALCLNPLAGVETKLFSGFSRVACFSLFACVSWFSGLFMFLGFLGSQDNQAKPRKQANPQQRVCFLWIFLFSWVAWFSWLSWLPWFPWFPCAAPSCARTDLTPSPTWVQACKQQRWYLEP